MKALLRTLSKASVIMPSHAKTGDGNDWRDDILGLDLGLSLIYGRKPGWADSYSISSTNCLYSIGLERGLRLSSVQSSPLDTHLPRPQLTCHI